MAHQQHQPLAPIKRRINITACKGSSLECIQQTCKKVKGWAMSDKPGQQTDDVYFVIQRESLHKRIEAMSSHSMVSKFPGMYSLCEKVHFTRAMNFATSMMPGGLEGLGFWPITWILPDEMDEVRIVMAKICMNYVDSGNRGNPPIWIVKPEAGCQGDGIFLVDGFQRLEDKMRTRLAKGSWVCQEYVKDPLLIDGLKFDLRVYASLISLDPVKVYVCKEGLARFCTEKYSPPDPKKGFGSETAHLTNYSLNKMSENFNHASDNAFNVDNVASKRPISTLLQQLKRKSNTNAIVPFDEEQFWDHTEECVAATVTAMLPVLRVSYSRYFTVSSEDVEQQPCQAFHLLGVDIMLRNDYSPVLIEVNNSPSLNLTQTIPVGGHHMPDITNKGRRKVGEKRQEGPPPRGHPCNCAEFATTHIHEISVVDEHCKTIAFGGTLELLPRFSPEARQSALDEIRHRRREEHAKGEQSLVQKWFFEVGDCDQEDVRDVLRMVEVMYNRCGGAKKAFTAGTLRREFSKVPGLMKKSKFTKSDLDIIAAKYRDMGKSQQKETLAEEGMMQDLAVLDWGVMIGQVCKKRFGKEGSLLAQMQKVLGRLVNPPKKKKAAPKKAASVTSEAGGEAGGGGDGAAAAAADPSKSEE